MINIDKGYIKNTPEYESVGENVFPINLLSDEEKQELGLSKKSCCGSNSGCCKTSNSKQSKCCKDKVRKCGK